MLTALICCSALLLALAVDTWPGEPAARLHPVVWMGNYLNWATGQLRPKSSPAIRVQPPIAQDALHNAWQQIKGMT